MGTLNGRVHLVDSSTGTTRWIKKAPNGANISTVAMAPDGRFVVSVNWFEEYWMLLEATNGAVCMTGARHDGTGTCSCSLVKSGRAKGKRETIDAGCTSAHGGITSGGVLAMRAKTCNFRPHGDFVGC